MNAPKTPQQSNPVPKCPGAPKPNHCRGAHVVQPEQQPGQTGAGPLTTATMWDV